MKKFIIKVTLLSILPMFIYTTFFYYLKLSYSNEISRYPIIVLGDSQTEFIRDAKIYNRSINGSPYFVQFKFSEEFIGNLKGKKIYIACNYHNFSKLYQNRLENDSLWLGWREAMFEELNEYHLFNQKHLELRPNDLDYTYFNIKKPFNLFKKVYLNNKNTNTSNSIIKDTLSISNTIQRHWYHNGYVLKDSIQKTYLNKLIILLKEHNCEVILLKMPLTNFYIDNVPNKVKDQLLELSNDHKVRILDLNKELSISTDYNYFKDFGHLNTSGDSLVRDYFLKNEIKLKTAKKVF